MTEEVVSNEDELFDALNEACLDYSLDEVVNAAIDLIVGAAEMSEEESFKKEVILALLSAAAHLSEPDAAEEPLIQLLN